MSHNDLVHEVTSQLSAKFQPDPLSVKKRLEHLIEVRPFSGTSARCHRLNHPLEGVHIKGRRPKVVSIHCKCQVACACQQRY